MKSKRLFLLTISLLFFSVAVFLLRAMSDPQKSKDILNQNTCRIRLSSLGVAFKNHGFGGKQGDVCPATYFDFLPRSECFCPASDGTDPYMISTLFPDSPDAPLDDMVICMDRPKSHGQYVNYLLFSGNTTSLSLSEDEHLEVFNEFLTTTIYYNDLIERYSREAKERKRLGLPSRLKTESDGRVR